MIQRALIGLAAVLLFAASATAQTGALKLAPVGSPAFPDRSFILSIPPGKVVDPAQIAVRENGTLMRGVAVSGAGNGGGDALGIALVIDSSVSMRGRPIKAAMQAAQALAAQRSPQQPLAIVTYNRRPRVVLAPTTDTAAIDRALKSRPVLRPGTQTYDGVLATVDLMRRAKLDGGSIVLLSDGVCRVKQSSTCRRGEAAAGGSSLSEAVGQARAANLRLFTVGLRGKYYDDAQLRALASQGRGEFLEAQSTADLAGIYARLGSRLANEYILRYRSTAKPGPVQVSVRAEGVDGIAVSSYTAPELRAPAPGRETAASPFWSSSLALVLTAAAAAALLGLALALAFVRGASASRIRRRIGDFVEVPTAATEAGTSASEGSGLWTLLERRLSRRAWWDPFKEMLDIGRVQMPAERIVGLSALGALAVGWLLSSIAAPLAVVALFTPLIVRWRVRRAMAKQRTLFDDLLADALQGTASALRAGYSLVGGLTVIAEDASEPVRGELQRVTNDERLGVPLDDALREMARRMDSRDVEQVAMVAVLQHETGGNIAEVLDRVTDVIRERNDLRRAVRALTAQGRMARAILTALPILLLLASSVLNYAYVAPLFETTIGVALLAIGAAMVACGSIVIGKIVDVKV